jgi:DNA topoisomerase-2
MGLGMLTDVEHVLHRPAMYTGHECGVSECEVLGLVGGEVRATVGAYDHVAAKSFDEVLVNAADCASRTSACTAISVVLDETGFAVENDGADVPLGVHDEWRVHVPEALFGRLRSSCNFGADRAGGGVNGVGCKLANVFSSEMRVTVRDATHTYTQRFAQNMRVADVPVVGATGPHSPSVRVECTLDAGRCALTPTTRAACARRLLDVAMTYPDVRVTLDGVHLDVERRAAAYAPMLVADTALESRVPGYTVLLALASSTPAIVSVVNAVHTPEHGPHVALVLRRLHAAVGAAGTEAQWRRFVEERAVLVVVARLLRPTFRGNEKASITGAVDPEPAPFPKSFRASKVAAAWAAWLEEGAMATLRREERKRGKVRLEKLDDATAAGTAAWRSCSIILTEGDSAKSFAVSGLAVVGRAHYGVFPLRGKVKNVRDSSATEADANKEISALKQILGLQSGVAADKQTPRYGRVLIMTDQDVDGFHIKGLILNFLDAQFSGVAGAVIAVDCFRTPLIKAVVGTATHEFFSAPEYAAFVAEHGAPQRAKYYKGLGTSTAAEARAYFSDLPRYCIRYDTEGIERLREHFSREGIGVRKAAVRDAMARCVPAALHADGGGWRQTVGEFVDGELMLYAVDAVGRAIPSVMDGLKPSQRKVLWTMLSSRASKETKVAQLAAHVAHETAYHHGEESLQRTIVAMAQDFVGANNVPLLVPVGQFGTRRLGGEDAASARYIYTKLAPVARHVFPSADFHLLERLYDEGHAVEPRYLAPIVPMLLVNGASGIATGFSTMVPPHHPLRVIEHVRAALRALEPPSPLRMFVVGYKGEVGCEPTRYTTRARVTDVEVRGKRQAHVIDELPVGTWTEVYKSALDALVDAKRATRYANDSTDVDVKFTVFGARREDLEASRHVSTRNMHALDERGVLRRWESAEEVVAYFCQHRLPLFTRRRESELARVASESTEKRAMMRFVGLVVEGGATALFRLAPAELTLELERLGFEATSHDALLSVPLRACTAERRAALARQIGDLEAEHARLVATTDVAMWLDELGALEAHLGSGRQRVESE